MAFERGEREPLVCARVRDGQGCWLCLAEVHAKFLSYTRYSTLAEQLRKNNVQSRHAIPDERQALSELGAIKRKCPRVVLYNVDSLSHYLRRTGRQRSAIELLEQVPVLSECNWVHQGTSNPLLGESPLHTSSSFMFDCKFLKWA